MLGFWGPVFLISFRCVDVLILCDSSGRMSVGTRVCPYVRLFAREGLIIKVETTNVYTFSGND